MSKQSFTNRIRDPERRAETAHEFENYGRRNMQPLIVGAILGLLLGLFIGWVVWPIQWTDTWPPDLAPKPKADYVAAVADAFVAARSDDAAAIAQQRLSSFGDLDKELADAVAYFKDNPTGDSALRITNIQELAAYIQPAATPEPPTEAIAVDAAEEASSSTEDQDVQDQTQPEEPGQSSNWLQLTLWLIAAFVLIAGGIWVLRAVIGPQSTPSTTGDHDDDDEIDEFSDEDLDDLHHEQPDDEGRHQADADDAGVGAVSAVITGAALAGDAPDDYDVGYVDIEVVATEEITAGSGPNQAPDTERLDDGAENPSIAIRSGTAGAVADSAFYDDEEGYGFGPETDLLEGGGSTTVIVDTELEPSFSETQADTATASDGAIPPEADAANEAGLKPTPLPSGREVGRYTATYYPMLDEYEEAFRIVDVDDGVYIGDCGMGVNMQYGFVQHNPEQVAALDVWLIDLVQGEAMSFHAHTLVSMYGAKNMPATKAGDGKRGEADEPQQKNTLESTKAGDRFQIVGEDLLVDGEVVSVSYMTTGTAEGVFQGLEVSLAVSRKL